MKNIFKTLFLSALLAFAGIANAQVADFTNVLSVSIKSDTVTNTATQYLQSPAISSAAATSTVIWIGVTKISGTVGGTISLLGSVDGTNYKAINTVDTQTALATITAADASGTYHYRLAGSPFPYYRVSWTGTGTMAASFTAKMFRAR